MLSSKCNVCLHTHTHTHTIFTYYLPKEPIEGCRGITESESISQGSLLKKTADSIFISIRKNPPPSVGGCIAPKTINFLRWGAHTHTHIPRKEFHHIPTTRFGVYLFIFVRPRGISVLWGAYLSRRRRARIRLVPTLTRVGSWKGGLGTRHKYVSANARPCVQPIFSACSPPFH